MKQPSLKFWKQPKERSMHDYSKPWGKDLSLQIVIRGVNYDDTLLEWNDLKNAFVDGTFNNLVKTKLANKFNNAKKLVLG